MKKNSLYAALIGALLVPLFVIQVQAQSTPRSTASGFVFDPYRRPVPDIRVELMNEVNSVLQRTRTDGSGRFFFSNLSSGRFIIRVLSVGTDFEEQTQDIEIAGIGAFGRQLTDNVQKDIHLRFRKENASVGAGAIFVQDVPDEAKFLFEGAVSDLQANRTQAATDRLESALKVFPTYYSALEKLGLIYIGQEKFENAREVFTKAVAVNSRSFNGWYGLSYANFVLKHAAAAVEAAQKAVSLNSQSADAQLFYGLSLRQAKRYEEAEKSLRQADKLFKGQSPDVHWNLALLYAHNLKRYNDAATELELYLTITPDHPNAENIRKLIKQYRENPPK
ncbi:MAG TPA: tetratricopeptide repeat protein [Pyrinomonadaceae bacterium]|nr:tetratricopeptide repeat protein [Pyrinomonadaceae bacterium]